MRRIRFCVTGRVQGVGFRAHTQAEAWRLGLVGFVRNRRDGAVEGEAEGAADAVAQFTTWLQKGAPWSRVDRVVVDEIVAVGREGDFELHH